MWKMYSTGVQLYILVRGAQPVTCNRIPESRLLLLTFASYLVEKSWNFRIITFRLRGHTTHYPSVYNYSWQPDNYTPLLALAEEQETLKAARERERERWFGRVVCVAFMTFLTMCRMQWRRWSMLYLTTLNRATMDS